MASVRAASWERAGSAPARQHRGLEVGEAVDGDRAVLVGQQRVPTAAASVRRCTPAASIGGAEPEPPGGVVVAAGDHHLGPRAGEPASASSASATASTWRERPVVDVAGDDDEVDCLGLDHLDQVVDERRLVPSSSSRWNDRPRCQSEVWRMRTGTTLGAPTDSRSGAHARLGPPAEESPDPRASPQAPGSSTVPMANGTVVVRVMSSARTTKSTTSSARPPSASSPP